MVSHCIVDMYKLIETTQQLEYSDVELIGEALDGVKFDLFPQLYATEDGKKQIAVLLNDYQANRFIIMRIDEWLRAKTDVPDNQIINIVTQLKYLYEIR